MINLNLYKHDIKTNISKNICFTGAERLLPNKQYPKKLIKLIVLDIDGTISDRATNAINPEIKAAIQSVINKGIKVILNTGRDYDEALIIAKELNVDTPIICNYGKYIKHNRKLIYENPSNQVDLKGDSLEYIANIWGIKKENIMAIGNDVEDISMFTKSGTSVLIEGSSYINDIKPFAHYIVDNFNKSGVALAIKKLILE